MKQLVYSVLMFILLTTVVISAATFPFPQSKTYPYGIKPNNYTASQMSNHIKNNFDTWRSTYLVTDACMDPATKRVKRPWNSDDTVSEGIGYGMLILVYMDNPINNTQSDFDAVFGYYEDHLDANGLMNWQIGSDCSTVGANAATDADEDVVLALLMAHKQWGSSGTVNYLSKATNLISKLMASCVEKPTYYLKPGDVWGGSDYQNPSYWSPAWNKLFGQVKGDSSWDTVTTKSYQVLRYFYNNYTTGLAPDWCKADGSNSGYSYDYKYDACRMPWRIGLDYLWNGTAQSGLAYSNTKRVASWINSSVGGNAANIGDAYNLSGSKLNANHNASFVGPFGVAAMSDSSLQTWCNSLYEELRSLAMDGGYYNDSLKILTMLVMSGNFPNFWSAGAVSPGMDIVSASVSPVSFTNNAARLITMYMTVVDSNGSIANVKADLSQLGGSSVFPLTNQGGNNWKGSYTVASGVSTGTKNILITATDSSNNTLSSNVIIQVYAIPSTQTNIYMDAGGLALPSGSLTAWGISETSGADAYEGTKYLTKSYSVSGSWDGFGLSVNNWGGDGTGYDFSNYDFLELSYKMTGLAGLYLKLADADQNTNHVARGMNSSKIFIGYSNSSYKTVRIPIQSFLAPGLWGVSDVRAFEVDLSGLDSASGTLLLDGIRLFKGKESVVTSSQKRIVCIGDDITVADAGSTGNASYRYYLWNMLTNNGYKNIDFVGSHKGVYASSVLGPSANGLGTPLNTAFDQDSEGWWGFKADELANAIPALMSSYFPDIALVHAGHNDLLAGQTVASTTNDMAKLIDGLRIKNSNITIILGQVIMPSSDPGSLFANYRTALSSLASQKNRTSSPVIIYDINTHMQASHLYDTFRPNNEGQKVMATNWYNALIQVLPGSRMSISSFAVTPNVLTNNTSKDIGFTAVVIDSNGSITGVSLNLSELGGPAALAMTNAGGNHWGAKYTLPAWSSAGIWNISLQATDNDSFKKTASTTIDIRDGNGISLTSLNVSPVTITNNLARVITLSAVATDSNGTISGVTANLAALGGGTAFPLTNQGGGIWIGSYTVPQWTSSGIKTLQLKAIDNTAHSRSNTVNLTIVDGHVGISLTSLSIAPSSFSNNLSRTITLTAVATDTNGSITGVTANLSPVGGSTAFPLTNQGSGNWKGSYTVPQWTSVGVKTIYVKAMDNVNHVVSNSSTVTVLDGREGVFLGSLAVTPSAITNNISRIITLTAVATDTNGIITEVTANLSPAGGSTVFPLTNQGSGNWRGSYTVSAGVATGTKNIVIKATDNSGNSISNQINLDVLSTTPIGISLTGLSITPSYISNNKNTLITLSAVASDSNGTITSVTVDLSVLGGSAAFSLIDKGGNVWSNSFSVSAGVSSGTNLIQFTATDSSNFQRSGSASIVVYDALIGISLTSLSIAPSSFSNNLSRVITLTAVATDSNGSITGVTANLSPVGGSTAFPLTNQGSGNWKGSYTVPQWTSVGVKTIYVKAMDNVNHVVSNSSTVTVLDGREGVFLGSLAVTPSAITNNISRIITMTAVASDSNGSVTGVTANLSPVGGSTVFPLTNQGSGNWKGSYTVAAGVGTGTKNIMIKAIDNSGNSISNQINLNVLSTAPIGICLTGLSISPSFISNNKNTLITLSAVASDSNGTITSVTVDLSVLGGSAAYPLIDKGGNVWSSTYTVPSDVLIGVKNIYFRAVDNSSHSLTKAIVFVVYEGILSSELNDVWSQNPVRFGDSPESVKSISLNVTADYDEVRLSIFDLDGNLQYQEVIEGSVQKKFTWDGLRSDGKMVNIGPYIWYVYGDGRQILKGILVVIR